jgi:hypothetical protein
MFVNRLRTTFSAWLSEGRRLRNDELRFVSFFLLVGVVISILLSVFSSGISFHRWNVFIVSFRATPLQACLVSIVVINSMFLSTIFLW